MSEQRETTLDPSKLPADFPVTDLALTEIALHEAAHALVDRCAGVLLAPTLMLGGEFPGRCKYPDDLSLTDYLPSLAIGRFAGLVSDVLYMRVGSDDSNAQMISFIETGVQWDLTIAHKAVTIGVFPAPFTYDLLFAACTSFSTRMLVLHRKTHRELALRLLEHRFLPPDDVGQVLSKIRPWMSHDEVKELILATRRDEESVFYADPDPYATIIRWGEFLRKEVEAGS